MWSVCKRAFLVLTVFVCSASLGVAGAPLSTRSPLALGFSSLNRTLALPRLRHVCFPSPAPIPTNTWWSPLLAPWVVSSSPTGQWEIVQEPVAHDLPRSFYGVPFIYTVGMSSVNVSYPFFEATTNSVKGFVVTPRWDWRVSGISPMVNTSLNSFCVRDGDHFTATLLFDNPTTLTSGMTAHLAQGSPFFTMQY
eukprot:RCo017451